jgi:Putative DNA-binding domain
LRTLGPEPLESRELSGIDVDGIIAGGESELVEFKSSARWDYREQKVNKSLEQVIVKTLASFLNARGGTLLIGVGDDGHTAFCAVSTPPTRYRVGSNSTSPALTSAIDASGDRSMCAVPVERARGARRVPRPPRLGERNSHPFARTLAPPSGRPRQPCLV